MAQLKILGMSGIRTAPNPLSAVPQGSLVRAENCIFTSKGVLEPRRGQKANGYAFGAPGDSGDAMMWFDESLLVHDGSVLYLDTGTGHSTLSSSISAPSPSVMRIKAQEASQSLYIVTSSGLYVMAAYNAAPVSAGVPAPLDLIAVVGGGNGTSGVWFTYDRRVAFRTVIGRKDANGKVSLGPPSAWTSVQNRMRCAAGFIERTAADGSHPAGRVTAYFAPDAATAFLVDLNTMVAGNTFTLSPGEANFAAGSKTVVLSGTQSGGPFDGYAYVTYNEAGANLVSTVTHDLQRTGYVRVQQYIPSDVRAGDFLRVYRSTTPAAAGVYPSDEVFLVAEREITSTDITNTFVAAIDLYTPDALLANPLYTNPNTGSGILASKHIAPRADDVCEWDNRLWLYNTDDIERFSLRLLGVGAPAGAQAADSITIGSYTLTLTAAMLYDYETPTRNVEVTARFLCYLLNRAATATFPYYLRYESATDDEFGLISIEPRSRTGAQFTVYASRPSAWSPGLTTSSTGAKTSESDSAPSGLAYSDPGEHDSFPLLNRLTVGPKQIEGLRCIALKDRLFLFPERGGIWMISGSYPYRVDNRDDTASLIAPDTAVKHANQIFALTTQGVCAISDAGVRIVSADIEDELNELRAALGDALKRYAFGVSDEENRQYQLWVPEVAGATTCTKAFVYNTLFQEWTTWTGSRTHGGVNPGTGRLHLLDGASNRVIVERKAFDRTDYADNDETDSILSFSGTSVTLDSGADAAVGDLLWQSDDVRSTITAVDAPDVTVATEESWVAGACVIKKAYEVDVKLASLAPQGPSNEKVFRETHLHFGRFHANDATAFFDSDKSTTETEVSILRDGFGLLGAGSWRFGEEPNLITKRLSVPQAHSRVGLIRPGFRMSEAWSNWSLLGATLTFEPVSERHGD